MKRLLHASILLTGAVLVASCTSSSGGGGGSGGSLALDQPSYTVTAGSSIGVVVTLSGSSDTTGVMVTVSSDNTSVAVPVTAPCTLSDQPGATTSCKVTVKGQAVGKANISATAPGVVTATAPVTVSQAPQAGTLTLNPTSESIVANATQTVAVALDGSSGITNTTVTLGSSNTAVATVTPSQVTLSSAQPTQNVTINGVAQGSATITATASGTSYTPVTNAATVTPSGSTPGTLSFGTVPPIPVGTNQTATISLAQSSNVSQFTVTLAPQNALVTVNPTSCPLSSATPNCNFSIIAGATAGGAPIKATASGYTPVTLMTTVAASPSQGSLIFSPPSTTVVLGSTARTSLSLSGSAGVTSLPVTLTSSSNVTVSPSTATLVPGTPFPLTVLANAVGAGTTITATATGYTSAVSNVTVQSSGHVVYGNLEFTNPNYSLLPSASAQVTLQLVDSSNVAGLTVNLSASPTGLVTLSQPSCSLSTATNSCTFNVTAGAAAGSTTLSTTAAGPAVQATASVAVNPAAASTYYFSNPSTVVIAQTSTGNTPSMLTMTNPPPDATPTTVWLWWLPSPTLPAQMGNSPGSCTFSVSQPTCPVNVTHSSASDLVSGPYTLVASTQAGGGTTLATLPVFIAASTPVDRTLTVVNSCPFTVWAGISGGAVQKLIPVPFPCPDGWTQVTPGSLCCPVGASPGDPYCYWTNPVPSNGYQLANGQSTQFTIPASAFNNSYGGWNGGIMARLYPNTDGSTFQIGDCTGGNGGSGYACTVGNSFATPQTLAEFTLVWNGQDTYDITAINGVIVPTSMGPTSVAHDPVDPYTNGLAGGTATQYGSLYTLNPANWTFDSRASDTSISSIYYNLVLPPASPQTCTTNATCAATQQVCGYTMASITKPGATYALVCGTRIGYLTADAIWKGNPDTTGGTNTAPFDFYATPGSSPFPGYTLIECPSPPVWSAYNIQTGQTPATTCGCTDWPNIATPTSACGTWANPDWVSYVLPKITWVKLGCPTCYSYQYDDVTVTFHGQNIASNNNAANGTGYTITFCPNGISVPQY
jgi:hypothetical protein